MGIQYSDILLPNAERKVTSKEFVKGKFDIITLPLHFILPEPPKSFGNNNEGSSK